jgi:hypothetical protein
MNGYDNHGTTLDPGLTALALRARARADESYVFMPRHTDMPWWRRAWTAAARSPMPPETEGGDFKEPPDSTP